MAPFRGRGGMRGRGRGRGGPRGGRGGRGGARGGKRNDFVAARVQDPVADGTGNPHAISPLESESDNEADYDTESGSEDEDEIEPVKPVDAYRLLLSNIANGTNAAKEEPRRKRRKLEHRNVNAGDEEAVQPLRDETSCPQSDKQAAELDGDKVALDPEENSLDDEELDEAGDELVDGEDVVGYEDFETLDSNVAVEDPFGRHFERLDDGNLRMRIKAISGNGWTTQKLDSQDGWRGLLQTPDNKDDISSRRRVKSVRDINLKARLVENAEKVVGDFDTVEQAIAPFLFDYQDVLFGARTVKNAGRIRDMCCLHALNHLLKTRDRITKNNSKLKTMSEDDDAEYRDQGFTRPKILFLLETKESCVRVLDSITKLFDFEQQENKKRFVDGYSAPDHVFSDDKPEDFRELFEGNDENEFRIGVKLTRKTIKYFSPFYTSDILFASTLGLRRAIESDDKRKRDHDFLSSIEMVIMEQADATLMQNWEHAEFVFQHLNLQPKEAHGCDFSRVRSWYLDGHAQHVRQTIVLSAYLAPKINTLYNKYMLNYAGRLKLTPFYDSGVIETLPYGIKQTFSRFDSPSYLTDPDTRFKYFSTTVLPKILKTPKPLEGGIGVLLFIPSYLDFVRVRNSLVDTDVSFASISEYTDATDVRRARSHFMAGRLALLLYTGRAHHFHRYTIRGVKRVMFYGVPENPKFYEEVVGFAGKTVERGEVDRSEASVRVCFSRWERLELERVVGAKRVGRMVADKGDMFDFV